MNILGPLFFLTSLYFHLPHVYWVPPIFQALCYAQRTEPKQSRSSAFRLLLTLSHTPPGHSGHPSQGCPLPLSSLCFLRWLFCFCFTFIGCPQSSALFSPDILPEQSQYTSISLFHLFNTIIYIDYCIIMDCYAYMDYI